MIVARNITNEKKNHAYHQYTGPEKMDLEQRCSGQNFAV
jgi:hypothetical protein